MSQQSYEFLASATDWENSCQGTPRSVDTLPKAFKIGEEACWTFPAQLLATLAVFDKDKLEPYRQTLASLAKDGGKKGTNEIRGYPGLLQSLNKNAAAWLDFAAPTPDLLSPLPHGSLLMRVEVKLLTPFYSRDDLPFYPTENALKRHKAFDTPYLSASGIKGLLRWAYRMANCTLEVDANVQFLFGVTNDTDDSGTQGALYCYPVFWSGTVGLEVINPQNRKTGAGTTPIKYEVLKPGGTANLYFLLANLPGRKPLTSGHVEAFLNALGYLLHDGGLSAKSSAGWGSVTVTGANAALRDMETRFAVTAGASAAQPSAAVREAVQQITDKAAEEAWTYFVKDNQLLPLEGNDSVFTSKRLRAVLGCSNSEAKDRVACHARLQEMFKARSGAAPVEQSPAAGTGTQTEWLWPEPGESDWNTFTRELLGVLEAKEQQA